MMRTTDGTVGLMIANAANQGIISLAAAECVLEILDAIGTDAQEDLDDGEPNPAREKIMQHRVDLCAGIRDAIEARLRREANLATPTAPEGIDRALDPSSSICRDGRIRLPGYVAKLSTAPRKRSP